MGGATYGGAMPTGGGCACNNGGAVSGMPVQGGCASGNCGTTQTYGSTPFDPGSGWTIQSTTTTPMNGEPVPAPAASGGIMPTPATGSIPNSAPAPVPPPVSSSHQGTFR